MYRILVFIQTLLKFSSHVKCSPADIQGIQSKISTLTRQIADCDGRLQSAMSQPCVSSKTEQDIKNLYDVVRNRRWGRDSTETSTMAKILNLEISRDEMNQTIRQIKTEKADLENKLLEEQANLQRLKK
ncbi:hypothetical protein EDEG_00602 [Edhazardia aedis USNM 41457]|uniref:Uncharacterized protein n=1 Tax=Edhazardia aedis (strain USNM 41457) TaxID=1003232 RepID=J9DC75_EDHAE|nr:hypothetical protein EDEG_00602 [Edhazardia aedis USNM 41457]|eukprot:EJW05346.1 hypothetical protein EDEG_00602 [Edhazardia aedis USNM 41457]